MLKRFNRHDWYYRLIDVSFVCQLLMVAAIVYKQLTGFSATSGVLGYPFDVIKSVGLFLPTLLVFQRWMRDDFSEMLWQRTAGTVLKAIVILPIPVMFIVVVAIGSRVSLGVDSAADYTSGPRLGDLPAELSAQLYGYTYSMAILWLIASMLFIFSFQWHRWRASR